MKHQILPWIAGAGMVIMAAQPVTRPYAQTVGIALMFAALTIGLGGLISSREGRETLKLALGQGKTRWLTLAVVGLAGVIVASGVGEWQREGSEAQGRAIPGVMWAAMMVALYLMGRVWGKKMAEPLIVATIIETLSLIGQQVITPGVRGGGLMCPANYNIASTLLVVGTTAGIAVTNKWWLRAGLVVNGMLGLLLCGSEEGIVAVIILTIAVLINKNTRKVTAASICVIAVILGGIALIPNNQLKLLYREPISKVQMVMGWEVTDEIAKNSIKEYQDAGSEYILNNRIELDKQAFERQKIFGNGYRISTDWTAVHNIPLVIVDQIGWTGAGLWMMMVGLAAWISRKNGWGWLWLGIAALCLFDNNLWTQAGCWIFGLVGISTAISQTEVKASDLIVDEMYLYQERRTINL